MNNILKIAIGATVAIGGALVVKHVVEKRKEHKYVTPNKENTKDETINKTNEKEGSFKERITMAATEKVMDILAWACEHEKELKGLGIVLTVAGGFIDLAFGLKKVTKRSKLFNEIHDLNGKVWQAGYDAGWYASGDAIYGALKKGNKVTIGEWIVKEAKEVAA